MHERHIVEGIVKQIQEKAAAAGAARVTKVTLVAEELSGLEESSIRMYFEELAGGTMLEGAELIVSPRPAQLRCNTCDMVFDRKIGEFNCPHCGDLGVLAKSGKEFYIDSIEVESA